MKFDAAMVQTACQTPLGRIVLAATGHGLAGLWFEGQRHWPLQLDTPVAWPEQPHHPVFAQVQQQLGAYFAGQRTTFDVPLDLSHGTVFQQAVWQALRAIPPGQTASYGTVSARLGRPAAVRAVGAAIGRNPVSIIVPCHRVVGARGALTGYAGGLERKSALLRLESALSEPLQ